MSDDLLALEAGLRRRRQTMKGVAIALGVSSVCVFAYAAWTISKSDRGRVKVTNAQPGMLSADELAAVEAMGAQAQAQGYYDRNPALGLADVRCPDGMVAIPESASIRAFCVDEHDLTNRELLACVDAGKCPEPVTLPGCVAIRDSAPGEVAHCASDATVEAFCEAQGRRGLDEEEWERAWRLIGDAFVRCAASPQA